MTKKIIILNGMSNTDVKAYSQKLILLLGGQVGDKEIFYNNLKIEFISVTKLYSSVSVVILLSDADIVIVATTNELLSMLHANLQERAKTTKEKISIDSNSIYAEFNDEAQANYINQRVEEINSISKLAERKSQYSSMLEKSSN